MRVGLPLPDEKLNGINVKWYMPSESNDGDSGGSSDGGVGDDGWVGGEGYRYPKLV